MQLRLGYLTMSVHASVQAVQTINPCFMLAVEGSRESAVIPD